MRALVAIALLTIAAPGRAGNAPVRPPERLSETGLYAPGGALVVAPENRPYAPQYPLWTDGASKARWIHLPAGTAIDTTDPDAWVFPVGTKLWKEFAFDGKKVETRLLWRVDGERWIFATYVWNDAGTDAVLAPNEGVPGAAEITPGKRHSIPSVFECTACHASAGSVPLGFSTLQLSDDRDPNAIHAEPLERGMVTLRTLVEERRLVPDRSAWVEDPPRIAAANPIERAVLGYLHGNCGHCHNPVGPLAPVGMVLSHPVTVEPGSAAPALVTTWDRSGHWEIPGLSAGVSRRIAAGFPERSTIVERMRSRKPSTRMPPLGTALPDRDAVALLESWIRGASGHVVRYQGPSAPSAVQTTE
jgi:hypothetical protein